MTRNHLTAWQEHIWADACPVCTAGPGDACLTENGNRKSEVHAARSRLSRQPTYYPKGV